MRSSARQPSTNRRSPGPAPRPLHYREFTGVCPPPWMVRRRGRIRTCNIRFQRPSCRQLHHPPIPCGLRGRDGHGLHAQSPAGHPPETDTARLCATMLRLVCHDKVDAAGTRHMGPVPVVIHTPDGWRTLRAFGGTRTRGLPLRRRTPYPLGHEGVVSSAVPTAVHGPDTHRAWNRTTIGIATITRSPPHTLYRQGPHHRTGHFHISTHGRPCARPDHSALQLWTRAPGRIRTRDQTGRNRPLCIH